MVQMAQDLRSVEQAADLGRVDAQFQLGLIYSMGDESPEDLVRAHMWLNLAAFRGLEEAKNLRQDLANQMTAAQIAEAQRLAREWLRQH